MRAKERGLELKVLFEEENASSDYSMYRFLSNFGVETRLDSNPSLMHNKFAILDGNLVITGSFNYTVSADLYNNENLVFIQSEEIANDYQKEFFLLWGS